MMDNTQFGENTLYVQRCYSATEWEVDETRSYGILADRVKDAIRERMSIDALGLSTMKMKAAGEKNPDAYIKQIPKGRRRRATIFGDAHPKDKEQNIEAQRNYELADMMTHSPTNPRNYIAWARDIALKSMKRGAHSPLESQRGKYAPIYEDLKNHKGTSETRELMENAINKVKAIEDERKSQSRHYIHLRPSIHKGRQNPYEAVD
jgi:hypothetical protein